MREALPRRCLWWVCLAAAATILASSVVTGVTAEGVTEVDGQCEVLKVGEDSPLFHLPTNLTVKPSVPGWWLTVSLEHKKEAVVCMRLEDKHARLKFTVLMGSCAGGDVRDYNYLSVSAPSGVWTSLGVDVAGDEVIVSASDGTKTSMVTHGPVLYRDDLQLNLTRARNVEAAVGCRTSCPGYRYASSGSDKKKTVRSWSEDSVKFYIRPGKKFVELQYEVAYTTPLGHSIFQEVHLIKQDSLLPQWHVVHLQHRGDLATVSLNHRPLKSMTLPEGCSFTKHTIRVKGDGLFSFICNPFDGNVEALEKSDSSVACLVPVQAGMKTGLIAVAILLVALLCLVLGLVLKMRQQQQKLKEEQQKLKEEQQVGEHLLKQLYMEKDEYSLKKRKQEIIDKLQERNNNEKT